MSRKNWLIVLIAFFAVIALCSLGILIEQTIYVHSEYNVMKVEKFGFPLPAKYFNAVSSEQGLRESIPNVGVGGEGTLNIYHNAIDYAVPMRTPVYATKSGKVITVYPSYDNGEKWRGHKEYGGMIEIQHYDNTRTLYAHLVRTDVKEGQEVKKGELIGASGGKRGMRGSGNSTGCHLHYAVYIDIEKSFEGI